MNGEVGLGGARVWGCEYKIGFGNTEAEARIANLGCKARGRPGDGPFDHKTGKGHVEFRKGEYHDALTPREPRRRLQPPSGAQDPPPRAQGALRDRPHPVQDRPEDLVRQLP